MKIAPIICTCFVVITSYSQTTEFTYQGRLFDQGAVANGSYDLEFTVHDAVTNGNPIGNPVTNSAVTVSNGLFTAGLDFGPGVFNGSARWLEIAARTNGYAGGFSVLAPRQAITSTPYAIVAANANAVSATNVSGTLAASQLPAVVVTNNTTNASLSGTFTGNLAVGGSGAALRLNDHPLYLRSGADTNNGLIYSGPTSPGFPFLQPDGPVLWGYDGGALATMSNGPQVQLNWTPAGVNVPNTLTTFNLSASTVTASSVTIAPPFAFSAPFSIYNPSFGSVDAAIFSGVSPSGTWIDLQNTGGGTNWLMISTGTNNGEGAGKLMFTTGNSPTQTTLIDQLVLESDNRVGIGTAHPASTLEVNGDTKVDGNITVGGNSTLASNLTVVGTSTLGGNTTVAGNLGIGTLSPAAPVHAFSPSAPSALFDGSWGAGTWVGFRNTAGGASWNLISTGTNNGEGPQKLLFYAPTGAEPIVMQPDGKVGIDTGYPSTTLEVNGDATVDGGLTVLSGATGVRIWGGGGPGVRSTLDLSTYNPGTNAPSNRLQTTDDTNWSAAWDFYSKKDGSPTNALISVMHIDPNGNVTIAGALTQNSDRNVKTNFDAVNAREVLDKVAALPISTWEYKTDAGEKHIGPMAQDFYSAFQVGPDDKHITTVDESGVALAAIQGLNQKVDALQNENARLREQNDALSQQMRAALAELKALENRK